MIELDNKNYFKLGMQKKIKALAADDDDDYALSAEKHHKQHSGLLQNIADSIKVFPSKLEQLLTYFNDLAFNIDKSDKKIFDAIDSIKLKQDVNNTGSRWNFTVIRDDKGLISSVRAVRE